MEIGFDMSPLRVGTMLRKDGTSMRVPWLPDLRTTRGDAWIVESNATRLRIRERGVAWGWLPIEFDQTLVLTAPRTVEYSVTGTMGIVPIPRMRKRYELLDAGRGWMQLRTEGKPLERPSVMRVDGSTLVIDFLGPMGTNDRKVLPIVQPGDEGYRPPPADWSSPNTSNVLGRSGR